MPSLLEDHGKLPICHGKFVAAAFHSQGVVLVRVGSEELGFVDQERKGVE